MQPPVLPEALKASPLAAELTPEQQATLAKHLAFRSLADGEVLVSEGASDDHLYVIVRGAIAITRNPRNPGAVVLFTLGPGDFMGELSFLDGTPHYAAAVAVGPTLVLALERRRLESLLDSDARLVYQVMRAIARTTHQIQRRLSMQSIELTNYIFKQHGRY